MTVEQATQPAGPAAAPPDDVAAAEAAPVRRVPLDRRHPDIFNDEEAAAYLGLESVRSLETLRVKFKLVGHRPVGKPYLYHRDDLDACARAMFGKDHAAAGQRGGRRA